MKKLIHLFIFCMMLSIATISFAGVGKNNFQFQISEYHTQRQGGQTLDVYIRYAMKDNVDYSQYFDYRNLRENVLKYLEPSADLPANVFWEIIVAKLAEELRAKYSLAGISVQFLVYPNEKGAVYEPGFHGPIYTVGDVIPLTQVVTPVGIHQASK